jgi:GNAT superfamily N-acetyltransferase
MNQQLKDFSEQALICAIAGICFVFTLPEARGKGIGAAITLAALQDTGRSSRGFSRILYGYPVYRRLGFQEYRRFELYEWKSGSRIKPAQ